MVTLKCYFILTAGIVLFLMGSNGGRHEKQEKRLVLRDTDENQTAGKNHVQFEMLLMKFSSSKPRWTHEKKNIQYSIACAESKRMRNLRLKIVNGKFFNFSNYREILSLNINRF